MLQYFGYVEHSSVAVGAFAWVVTGTDHTGLPGSPDSFRGLPDGFAPMT